MRIARYIGVAALSLAGAGEASANSMVTHVWVAEQSIARVEGPLRDIVGDPALRAVIQNGAIYPDSGYSVRADYGEWAHWESFLEPYLQWIRARYQAENYRSPDARRHVAFLMGNAAHSMTDQTFDQYFVERVRQYDRTDANDLDVGSDTWLIVEHNVTSAADGAFWFDEMPGIHMAVNGPPVTPELLRRAAGLTAGATQWLPRIAHTLYALRWRQMPWGGSHYMDPATPGSYPQIVSATAAYWSFLWQRLQNAAPADAAPLYSWPAPSQTNFPVDRNDIESRIVVTTAWGLDDATVSAATVRVIGPDESVVPARVSRYGSEGNTVMVRTDGDLAFNTAYRVELAGTIRAYRGAPIGRALTIPFRTRCAPDRLADCPAIPVPLPTLADPPVSNPQPPEGMDAGTGTVVMVDDAGLPTKPPMSRPAASSEGSCSAGRRSDAGVSALAMLAVCAAALRRRSKRG